MKWKHPLLGEIDEMRSTEQVTKGWKHLYDPAERWDQLTDIPAEQLHTESRRNGCPGWSARGEPRHSGCRDCIRWHHDKFWREAYGSELMRTDQSHIGHCRFPPYPTVLATPGGVWIVLSKPNADYVFNAYRPHPRGRGVYWTTDDFARQALRRFQQKTGMRSSTPFQSLELLPSEAANVWHLALAVAAARARGEAAESQLLATAEERLGNVSPVLIEEALPPIHLLLDRLEEALHGGMEPMELADALLEVEDSLQATEVLLGTDQASTLLERVCALAAWAPVDWLALEELASARAGEVAGTARAWWQTVEDVLASLEVSAVEPIQEAAASLAPGLLQPAWWERMAALLASVPHHVLPPQRVGLMVGAAALGGHETGQWVSISGPPGTGVRVFLVDSEHPAGEEVTEDVQEQGPFWELTGPTKVVFVTGVRDGDDLEQTLEAASQVEAATVRVVDLSQST